MKFKENAAFSGLYTSRQIETLLDAIQRIETCDDVSRFVQEHLAVQRRTE